MSRRSNCMSSKGKRYLPAAVFAVLSVGMVLGPEVIPPRAEACPPLRTYRRDPRPTIAKVKGRWEVKLQYYYKYYSFRGGSYRLNHVYLFTKDEKLARWISRNGRSGGFWSAVRRGMQRFHCGDLLAGKRLMKLERGVAGVVADYYHKKTKRKARKLDVMLGINSYWRRYCNPPSKPPRSKRQRP